MQISPQVSVSVYAWSTFVHPSVQLSEMQTQTWLLLREKNREDTSHSRGIHIARVHLEEIQDIGNLCKLVVYIQ